MISQNQKKILLIGSGQQARVCIDAIEEQNKYKIFGLITHDPKECGNKIMGYQILGVDHDIQNIIRENKDIQGYFLGVGVSAGSMRRRCEIYTFFDKHLKAVSVISPEAKISRYCNIGSGAMIEAYARVSNGVKIGNQCIVQSFTSVNHDQIIGDNVLIGCNVSMAGVSVGSHSIISDGSSIGFKKSIGENCLIADGAVVTRNVPSNSIAFGNPAKTIKNKSRL